MQILLIKIAVIVVFWSGGMFALNKIFGMILKRKELPDSCHTRI